MIKREHYLSKIREFYDSDLIKVITGIRRCGKSVIKDQIIEEIRQQSKPVISLNFEERAISSEISNADELEAYITQKLSPNAKTYVFLDEVQLVEDWNLACRSLRLKNLSLFITGSNSKLLSREFTKELSGRYVAFCIRPFVYKELSAYAAELGKEYSIEDYLIYGGFPKILEFDTRAAMLQYLNDLDEQIIMNDIMNRYNIRKKEIFRMLTNYILISNARIFSANATQRFLKGQNIICSVSTIMRYVDYLKEAYAIRGISQYSTLAKRELKYFDKIYDEDVAFNSIRQRNGRFDITHNMENIIYNELIYMGYDLSVFNKAGREIDFLAEKEGKQYLIQVAYTIADESTYNREFALFNQLDQSMQKIIITNDNIDYSTSTVRHIPFREFLMLEDLQ